VLVVVFNANYAKTINAGKPAKEKRKMQINEAVALIVDELMKAEKKFPTFPIDYVHASAVVAEEAGELVKATLEATYHYPNDPQVIDEVCKEAIQTGAMALRFLVHLEDMKVRQSEQKQRQA